ncbi:hypothetical protein K9N68_37635 (plasmid) [Kovacikia minuta CCNUW1]|uniref:hypothetical protein n=1 Tax=Kovacikia minuta TaxID=2931930 RepID=UPI001CC9D72F|nr:hypothetical protein [Kovacikia minuta]UBF29936.1 hypothetical protein K9N68_37635 [Kovacikia minuta CCNUW1]
MKKLSEESLTPAEVGVSVEFAQDREEPGKELALKVNGLTISIPLCDLIDVLRKEGFDVLASD